MESFEDVSCQMLKEFSALIQHTPPPIGNNRLLQLMSINMFAIDNTAPKGLGLYLHRTLECCQPWRPYGVMFFVMVVVVIVGDPHPNLDPSPHFDPDFLPHRTPDMTS